MRRINILALNSPGYAVLKGWGPDTTGLAERCSALKKVVPIFNTPENDYKRQQVVVYDNDDKANPFQVHARIPKQLRAWLKRVIEKVHDELSTWGSSVHHYVGEATVLRSEPGCRAQVAHCDYVPTPALLSTTDATVPLLLLVALQDNTTFDVWPQSHRLVRRAYYAKKPIGRSRIVLDKGDAVLFRGDLVHAGSDFEASNTRVHLFIDSAAVKRPKDQTWTVSEFAPPAIAACIDEHI